MLQYEELAAVPQERQPDPVHRLQSALRTVSAVLEIENKAVGIFDALQQLIKQKISAGTKQEARAFDVEFDGCADACKGLLTFFEQFASGAEQTASILKAKACEPLSEAKENLKREVDNVEKMQRGGSRGSVAVRAPPPRSSPRGSAELSEADRALLEKLEGKLRKAEEDVQKAQDGAENLKRRYKGKNMEYPETLAKVQQDRVAKAQNEKEGIEAQIAAIRARASVQPPLSHRSQQDSARGSGEGPANRADTWRAVEKADQARLTAVRAALVGAVDAFRAQYVLFGSALSEMNMLVNEFDPVVDMQEYVGGALGMDVDGRKLKEERRKSGRGPARSPSIIAAGAAGAVGGALGAREAAQLQRDLEDAREQARDQEVKAASYKNQNEKLKKELADYKSGAALSPNSAVGAGVVGGAAGGAAVAAGSGALSRNGSVVVSGVPGKPTEFPQGGVVGDGGAGRESAVANARQRIRQGNARGSSMTASEDPGGGLRPSRNSDPAMATSGGQRGGEGRGELARYPSGLGAVGGSAERFPPPPGEIDAGPILPWATNIFFVGGATASAEQRWRKMAVVGMPQTASLMAPANRAEVFWRWASTARRLELSSIGLLQSHKRQPPAILEGSSSFHPGEEKGKHITLTRKTSLQHSGTAPAEQATAAALVARQGTISLSQPQSRRGSLSKDASDWTSLSFLRDRSVEKDFSEYPLLLPSWSGAPSVATPQGQTEAARVGGGSTGSCVAIEWGSQRMDEQQWAGLAYETLLLCHHHLAQKVAPLRQMARRAGHRKSRLGNTGGGAEQRQRHRLEETGRVAARSDSDDEGDGEDDSDLEGGRCIFRSLADDVGLPSPERKQTETKDGPGRSPPTRARSVMGAPGQVGLGASTSNVGRARAKSVATTNADGEGGAFDDEFDAEKISSESKNLRKALDSVRAVVQLARIKLGIPRKTHGSLVGLLVPDGSSEETQSGSICMLSFADVRFRVGRLLFVWDLAATKELSAKERTVREFIHRQLFVVHSAILMKVGRMSRFFEGPDGEAVKKQLEQAAAGGTSDTGPLQWLPFVHSRVFSASDDEMFEGRLGQYSAYAIEALALVRHLMGVHKDGHWGAAVLGHSHHSGGGHRKRHSYHVAGEREREGEGEKEDGGVEGVKDREARLRQEAEKAEREKEGRAALWRLLTCMNGMESLDLCILALSALKMKNSMEARDQAKAETTYRKIAEVQVKAEKRASSRKDKGDKEKDKFSRGGASPRGGFWFGGTPRGGGETPGSPWDRHSKSSVGTYSNGNPQEGTDFLSEKGGSVSPRHSFSPAGSRASTPSRSPRGGNAALPLNLLDRPERHKLKDPVIPPEVLPQNRGRIYWMLEPLFSHQVFMFLWRCCADYGSPDKLHFDMQRVAHGLLLVSQFLRTGGMEDPGVFTGESEGEEEGGGGVGKSLNLIRHMTRSGLRRSTLGVKPLGAYPSRLFPSHLMVETHTLLCGQALLEETQKVDELDDDDEDDFVELGDDEEDEGGGAGILAAPTGSSEMLGGGGKGIKVMPPPSVVALRQLISSPGFQTFILQGTGPARKGERLPDEFSLLPLLKAHSLPVSIQVYISDADDASLVDLVERRGLWPEGLTDRAFVKAKLRAGVSAGTPQAHGEGSPGHRHSRTGVGGTPGSSFWGGAGGLLDDGSGPEASIFTSFSVVSGRGGSGPWPEDEEATGALGPHKNVSSAPAILGPRDGGPDEGRALVLRVCVGRQAARASGADRFLGISLGMPSFAEQVASEFLFRRLVTSRMRQTLVGMLSDYRLAVEADSLPGLFAIWQAYKKFLQPRIEVHRLPLSGTAHAEGSDTPTSRKETKSSRASFGWGLEGGEISGVEALRCERQRQWGRLLPDALRGPTPQEDEWRFFVAASCRRLFQRCFGAALRAIAVPVSSSLDAAMDGLGPGGEGGIGLGPDAGGVGGVQKKKKKRGKSKTAVAEDAGDWPGDGGRDADFRLEDLPAAERARMEKNLEAFGESMETLVKEVKCELDYFSTPWLRSLPLVQHPAVFLYTCKCCLYEACESLKKTQHLPETDLPQGVGKILTNLRVFDRLCTALRLSGLPLPERPDVMDLLAPIITGALVSKFRSIEEFVPNCIARETWIPLEVPDILHSQTAVDLFFFVQQSFESCLTLSPLVHWFLKPFLGFLTRVSNRYCQAVKKHRESPFAFRLSQRATVNFQSLDLRLKLVCDKVELPPDPIPPPEKSLLSVSNLTRAGHRRVPSAQEFGTHQAPASTSVTPRGEGDDTQGRGGGTRRRWLGGLNLFGRSGTRTPRQDPTEEQGVSPGGGGWPGDSGGERDSPPGRTRRRSLGRTGGGGEMPLSDSEVVHERGERGLSPDGSGGQRRGRFFQELVGAVTGGHDRDGGAEWEGAARNRGPGRGKKKKKKRWKNPFGGGGGGGKGSDREETERPNNRWGMRNFFGRGGGGDRRSGGEEAEVTENEANGGDGGSSGDDSDSSIPSEFEREGLGKIFLVKGRKCNAGYETARLINLGPQAVNADGTLVHDPEVKGAKGKKAKGKGVRYEKSEAETAMLTETVPQLLVRLHNLAFMVDELDDLAEKLMRNARTELTALLQDPWLDEAKDRLGLEKEKAAREFAALRRQDSGTATDEGGVSRTPSGLLLRRSVMPMGTGVFAGVAVTSDVPRFSAGGPQTPTSNRGSVSSMGKRRTSKLGQRQSIRFAPDVVDGGRPSLGGISENKEMTDMDNMPTPKHGGGGDGGGKSESVIEEELAEMSEILNTALDQCDITAERAGEELCKYLAARVVYHEFQEELFVNLYKPQRRKASGSTGPSGSALESQDEGDSASERGGALGAGRGRGGSMEEGGGLTTLTDVLRVMEERAAPFLSHAPPAMSSHLWRALVFEIAHAWLWVITQMGRAGLNFIDDSRDPDPDHEIAVTTLQKDLTALVQFARGRADVGADFEVSVAGVPKKTQTHVVNARSKFGSSHTDSISSGTSSEDAIATTGAGKKEEKDEGPPPTVCFPLPPPFEPTKVNLFKYLGGIFFLLRDHPNCLKSEASETRKFLGG